MSHLCPALMIAASQIESFVFFTAVQNTLVATHIRCDRVQRLNHFETEMLALFFLQNRNFLDVTYDSEVVNTVSGR